MTTQSDSQQSSTTGPYYIDPELNLDGSLPEVYCCAENEYSSGSSSGSGNGYESSGDSGSVPVQDFDLEIFTEYSAIAAPVLDGEVANVLTIAVYGNPKEQLSLSVTGEGITDTYLFTEAKLFSFCWLSSGSQSVEIDLRGNGQRQIIKNIFPDIMDISPSGDQSTNGSLASALEGVKIEDARKWMSATKHAVGFVRKKKYDVIDVNNVITSMYAKMFIKKDHEFLWSGMAAFASDEVGHGIAKAQVIREEGGNPIIAFGAVLTGAPTGIEIIHALGSGNMAVYLDMYWQHLAYDEKGIDGIQFLLTKKMIDNAQRDGWVEIDNGRKSNDIELVWKGNKELLEYEQNVVLQKIVYSKYGKALDFLSSYIESPIPGDSVMFRDYVPAGKISNINDRWKWISGSMLPAYKNLWTTDLKKLKNELKRLPTAKWHS